MCCRKEGVEKAPGDRPRSLLTFNLPGISLNRPCRKFQRKPLHHASHMPPLGGGGGVSPQTFSINATACAAMPEESPVKPSFSSVVALTLTRSAGMPMWAARFSRIWGM